MKEFELTEIKKTVLVDLKVIDGLIALDQGVGTFFEGVLSLYLENSAKLMFRLMDDLEARDEVRWNRGVHELYSISNHLGCTRVAKVCLTIEHTKKFKDTTHNTFEHLFKLLTETVSESIHHLKKLRKTRLGAQPTLYVA